MKFDRQTVKTVILTALVFIALFAAWQGVQAIRRGDAPGRQAAAYLDALIRLGKMPSGADVEKAVAQAMAQANAPAIQGEYIPPKDAAKPADPKAKAEAPKK